MERPGGYARRELLRLGLAAGLAAPLLPGRARAAAEPLLTPRVDALVARWVGPGRLPGMVFTIGARGAAPRVFARGSEGFADRDPVTADSLFRIYSMTKPITGMAAMILIDEGRMHLDQPLAEILPRYAHMAVQDVPDGAIGAVHPARTPIRLRNLLTHTAGLGYGIVQHGPLREAMIARGVVTGRVSRVPVPGLDRGKPAPSLALFADRLSELPLVYEPGTRWSYSLGLDLMGRVIEVVSGMAFDRFLQQRLFDPLGMTSTFFRVPAREAHRLTTNHAVIRGVAVPIDSGAGSIYLDKPPYPMGGSGLVASPRDYDRFLAMIGNYGTLGGRRVMSERAVRMGTSNLMPPGVSATGMRSPGGAFGAGGMVGSGADAGAYGWAGIAGTIGVVNLRTGFRTQLYAQFMPPGAFPVLRDYGSALKQDLEALVRRMA